MPLLDSFLEEERLLVGCTFVTFATEADFLLLSLSSLFDLTVPLCCGKEVMALLSRPANNLGFFFFRFFPPAVESRPSAVPDFDFFPVRVLNFGLK